MTSSVIRWRYSNPEPVDHKSECQPLDPGATLCNGSCHIRSDNYFVINQTSFTNVFLFLAFCYCCCCCEDTPPLSAVCHQPYVVFSDFDRLNKNVFVFVCICVCMRVCAWACMFVFVGLCACVYACACVCVCMYLGVFSGGGVIDIMSVYYKIDSKPVQIAICIPAQIWSSP